MDGQTVTADTDLEAFDRALEQESTSRRRAFDFNNDALSRVFPEFFEFLEELEPLSSQDSTATSFSFPDTSDQSQKLSLYVVSLKNVLRLEKYIFRFALLFQNLLNLNIGKN